MSLSPKGYRTGSWRVSTKRTSFKRTSLLTRTVKVLVCIAAIWTALEVFLVRRALSRNIEPSVLGGENVFIASIHWNNEAILRSHWIAAIVETAIAIKKGNGNVYVSIQESGSWDDTKAALRSLDAQLQEHGIPRTIILDKTTHLDEINKIPVEEDWILTPRNKVERRRIPYLAKLRNLVMQPMLETNVRYDKVLLPNDVVFTKEDVAKLLSTNNGNFASACSLDFSKPPSFYDTFALRDSEGGNKLKKTWPFFRSRRSRQALKANEAVPVSSCWNGIVAMDAAPFYDKGRPLRFRGIPETLAKSHLEASECCLIHADNPMSASKGVWVNPRVRVGYSAEAYRAVNPPDGHLWLSTWSIIYGSWQNRFLRWFTTAWFKDRKVAQRLSTWEKKSPRNVESGFFCLVDEMQVLVENGWAHV